MAILRYEGAPTVDPAGAMPPPPLTQTLKDTDLHPLHDPAAVRHLPAYTGLKLTAPICSPPSPILSSR